MGKGKIKRKRYKGQSLHRSKELVELLQRDLSRINAIQLLLDIGIRPLVGHRALALAESSELAIALLLGGTFTQVQSTTGSGGQFDDSVGAVLAHLLVNLEGLVDGSRGGIGELGEHGTNDTTVFDGLGGTLGEMGQGRVAGITDEGDGLVHPGGEGLMDTQLPLADFTLGDVVQHTLDHGAEVAKDAQHDGLVTAGGVGGIGGGGEVSVGLGGGEVVDGVVGDGVGDDMALLADPASHAVAVHELQELRVVLDLVLVDHDTVGGLVGVLDAGLDVEEIEHGHTGLGLDAITGEEDIGLDAVGLLGGVAGGGSEGGLGAEGGVAGGSGEVEVDLVRVLQATLVQVAGEGRPVANHVRISVGIVDIFQWNVGQF